MGRRAELDRLRVSLEQAASGRGRIVLVSGEPGVGKTRMAQELSELASGRGFEVAWGSCFEGQGAPLYWPWVLVLRGLLRSRGPAKVRRQMGAGVSAIAVMLPDVAQSLGPAPALPRIEDPSSARFRFHDAMAGFLSRAAADTPLLIVIDDLHWADAPSLALLQFLPRDVARSRIFLVASYRDVEVARDSALERTLAALAREEVCERLALHALGRDDVKQYLAAVQGSEQPENLVDAVHSGTEGNAFFMTEVVRLLRDEAPRGLLRLPASVREVVRHRLARLPPHGVRALSLAAAVGREVPATVVARLLDGASEHDVVAFLEGAAGAGFIERVEDGWRFTHVLVQQALIEDTPLADRPSLHARIAAALEMEYGQKSDEHAREILRHMEAATGAVDPDRLVEYLAKAGDQALAAYAFEDARECFRRAIAVVSAEAQGPSVAELWFGLGKAQSALMDREAADSLSTAFERFAVAGLAERATEAAAHRCFWLGTSEQAERHEKLCERALAMVDKGSLKEAALLLQKAWYARARLAAADQRDELERALAIARAGGGAELEVAILQSLTDVADELQDKEACIRHAREALDAARRTDDLQAQCRALLALCNRLHTLMAAPVKEEIEHADNLLAAARRFGDHEILFRAVWARERAAWDASDWALARELNRECRSLLPTGERNPFLICNAAAFEYEVGEIEAGDRELGEAVELARSPSASAYLRASVAQYVCRYMLMTARRLWLDDARRFAAAILTESPPEPLVLDYAEQARGLLAVIDGDQEAARARYDMAAAWPRDGYHLWLSFIPGLLARTTGRMDDAVRHLREGVAFGRERLESNHVRWHLLFLAETLLQRSTPGDRDEAAALVEELITLADGTGSVLVGKRARSLRESMVATPSAAAAPVPPDGLTEREVEVLRLLARGYTNAEIGERLFISLHTVATHVHRILDKTGMANRTELTAYAIRNALAEA